MMHSATKRCIPNKQRSIGIDEEGGVIIMINTYPRHACQALPKSEPEIPSTDGCWRTEETAEPSRALAEHPEARRLEPTPARFTPLAVNATLAVPDADPTFWIEEQVAKFLHVVEERSRKGEIINVLLVGPTGTGKSSLPREFAAKWQHPFFTMHCQMVTEPGDWWGTREMSPELGTYFRRAALLDAAETTGCVILLDEANRTHPENLNALFGFLDHRRRAWIPALHREVAVAPGVVFFVTLNEGIDYVGTNAVDKALRDRIPSAIRLEYPPRRVEMDILVKRIGIDAEAAGNLVELAHVIRKNPKLGVAISTRQLLECAALLKEGLRLHDAVMFALVNGTEENVDRKAILQALQFTGDLSEAYVQCHWDDGE